MTDAVLVLSGVLIAGLSVTALFFARFWFETRDRLFALFCAAFALLAVQRIVTVAVPSSTTAYALRFIAFSLIIIAIADKNRTTR